MKQSIWGDSQTGMLLTVGPTFLSVLLPQESQHPRRVWHPLLINGLTEVSEKDTNQDLDG